MPLPFISTAGGGFNTETIAGVHIHTVLHPAIFCSNLVRPAHSCVDQNARTGLFSVPRSLRASPNHVDFRELQLNNRRLEGCSDSCSLEAGYQSPLICCLHCFSILHSLPGPQWDVGDGYPAFQQTGAQRTQGKGTRLLRVRADLHWHFVFFPFMSGLGHGILAKKDISF